MIRWRSRSARRFELARSGDPADRHGPSARWPARRSRRAPAGPLAATRGRGLRAMRSQPCAGCTGRDALGSDWLRRYARPVAYGDQFCRRPVRARSALQFPRPSDRRRPSPSVRRVGGFTLTRRSPRRRVPEVIAARLGPRVGVRTETAGCGGAGRHACVVGRAFDRSGATSQRGEAVPAGARGRKKLTLKGLSVVRPVSAASPTHGVLDRASRTWQSELQSARVRNRRCAARS